ncbi:MAG: hypothetical protein IPL61_25735 [Myxococcales bacterium]|nr:hypothetical protein [Myxococcales bacterium]
MLRDLQAPGSTRNLARAIGIELPNKAAERHAILADVERVKCKLSSLNSGPERKHLPAMGLPCKREMEREDLEQVSDLLWQSILPTYLVQAEQLLIDLQSGADAEFFHERLEGLTTIDVGGAQQLIDGVILAGGTSQLPGFRRAMLRHLFPDRPDMYIYTVGEDYSVAAALGCARERLGGTSSAEPTSRATGGRCRAREPR